MPPPKRSFQNPAPKTDSAREALQAFYCQLCQKGYSRQNELDAHQSSYEHNHRQRLKDMKQIQKDPQAAEKARKAELRADRAAGIVKGVVDEDGGGKRVKVGGGTAGFKKAGFSKASFKSVDKDGSEDLGKKVGLGEGKKGGFSKLFKSVESKEGEEKVEEKKPADIIPGLVEISQQPSARPPHQGLDEELSDTDDDDNAYNAEAEQAAWAALRLSSAKDIPDWPGNDKFWNEPDPEDYYNPMEPSYCGSDCPCGLPKARFLPGGKDGPPVVARFGDGSMFQQGR